MKKHSKQNLFFCIAFLIALCSSCTTSTLYNVWRDSSFTATPINHILVVTAKRNTVYRRYWEDGLVDEFEQRGINATPSYRLFQDSIPSINALLDSVQSYNFGYILMVNRVSTKMQLQYHRGHGGVRPHPQEREELRRDYQSFYDEERQQPPYPVDPTDVEHRAPHDRPRQTPVQSNPSVPEKIVRHEIRIYTTPGAGQLIWIGTGDVIDPSSSLEVNNEIINLIGPELEAEGFIPARKTN